MAEQRPALACERLCCLAELWEAGCTQKHSLFFSRVLLGWASGPAPAPVTAYLQASASQATDLTTSDSLPSGEGAEPGALSIWGQCPVSQTDLSEHFHLGSPSLSPKESREEGKTHHLGAGHILSMASGHAVTYHLGAP